MMETKFSEDIVTVSDLKINPGKIVRQFQRDRTQLLIIDNVGSIHKTRPSLLLDLIPLCQDDTACIVRFQFFGVSTKK